MLPLPVRILRHLLRPLNNYLKKHTRPVPVDEPFPPDRLQQAETELRRLHSGDSAARSYLEKHIGRLARTLALVPPPSVTGRVLELGCYMQITPLLNWLCGYPDVRGAYYGPHGRIDRKTICLPDGEFVVYIDHFDAERDPFPYPDGHFDLVIAGELIEHLTYDPMHMLLETRRILRDGGFLLITTPNIGSVTSVAKTLGGRDNPQIYSLYSRPAENEAPEIGHVREYTLHELGAIVRAAGFDVQQLFTTFISEYAAHRPLLLFLELNGYDVENRGEQSWCVAVKRAGLPVDRFPSFLYVQ